MYLLHVFGGRSSVANVAEVGRYNYWCDVDVVYVVGQLYAVNGPASFPQSKPITVQGFTMDPNTAQVVNTWAPPDGVSSDTGTLCTHVYSV